MLKPILKEPSVNESERVLSAIVSNTFFSLWCYPSLFRSTGKGKEFADLTIYFNNTLVIFSDKGHVNFQEHNDIQLAWSRWYRAAVKESAKQLHGAESLVRNHPDKLFLNSKLEDPFPFDLTKPGLKIHLVAVTGGIGQHAQRYYDSLGAGSRGTLVYSYQAAEDYLLKKPFLVGDVDPRKTFVHVLDESGLKLLFEELCTPEDFIHFLDTKERVIRSGAFLSSAGEEETLASYLQEESEHGFGDLRVTAGYEGHCFRIPEGEWKYYRQTVAYALRHAHKKNAKLWNQIIARFADAITDACVGEAKDVPLLGHSDALQILASENLYSSSFLASSLFEKFNQVPKGMRSARTAPSTAKPDRLYIFLFFPWDDSFASYQEYREARRDCMQLYASVAMYKYQKAKEILIFGADTKGSQVASETIIAVDASVPLTSEGRKMAQHAMKTLHILDHVSERVIQTSNSGADVGRNDPCPCGSKKKYKKCCMGTGMH
ncbi:YecA family protein [Pseudomonas syringae]|uniref:YecA family protein n=1 Tax=Pseudomonas syringae TaxID=317 RepID=UPI0034D406B7